MNYFTKPQIDLNEYNEKQNAIKGIFGSSVKADLISEEGAENEIYVIEKGGMIFGYCASVAPNGFGGEIKMMVGVDSTKSCLGVTIVSMSETPGLGSRTNTPTFLDQFEGKGGVLKVGENVDAVSGATISSKAVTKGINEALAMDVDLEKIAADRGTTVYTEELDTTPETEAVTEEKTAPETDNGESQTEAPAQLRVEDTILYVDHIDASGNVPAGERPAIEVEIYTETDVYMVETKEPQKDWNGEYIFPEDEENEEEGD